MKKHTFELFADYSQFLLSDENSPENFETFWTESTHRDKLAIGDNVIGVRTIQATEVVVDVEVHDSPLERFDDAESWYQVAECSLDIPSGKLVVMGVTDFFPEAARILVDPGTYRVRIHYGNRSYPDASHEGEYYLAILWRGTTEPVSFIKRPD